MRTREYLQRNQLRSLFFFSLISQLRSLILSINQNKYNFLLLYALENICYKNRHKTLSDFYPTQPILCLNLFPQTSLPTTTYE